MFKKELLLLISILALGAFLRFHDIAATPPGLYPDEAMNGNNALEAMHTGEFKIFYPENNGREGLFINIQAISLWLFGREPWALRIVSAIFGTLTILGVYLVAKELFSSRRDPEAGSWKLEAEFVAFLSAFFLATNYWHLNFSRIGFRAIVASFFLCFGLYFLLKGFRTNRILDMVFAGIFIGLGFHTYIVFRFVPFLLAVPILWKLRQWRKTRPELRDKGLSSAYTLGAIALFLLITFVTALPVGWYFLQHPADFIGRGEQVAIFSAPSPIREFFKSSALTLGMFFFKGDCNQRHNYACQPELNPVVAIFFAMGLFFSIKIYFSRRKNPNDQIPITNKIPKQNNQKIQGGYRALDGAWDLEIGHYILLVWLVLMSLPATLTREGLPHALRSIAMIPPVMILAGLGAYEIFRLVLLFLNSRRSLSALMMRDGHDISKKVVYVIGVLLALLITYQTYSDYFLRWAKAQNTKDAFATDLWHVGQYLDATPHDVKKYVIVNLNGDLIRGIKAPAQTVMFATDTFREDTRAQKNFVYINSADELPKIQISDFPRIIVAPLNKNDPTFNVMIRERFPQLLEKRHEDFVTFEPR